VVRRVVSPETAKRLTAILTDVVGTEDGTGKHARIVNVAVAGKTGTSQKFDFSRRVYSSERVKTSFMGFFPAGQPAGRDPGNPRRTAAGQVGRRRCGPGISGDRGADPHPLPDEHPREFPLGRREARRRCESPARLRSRTAHRAGAPEAPESDDALVPDFRGMSIREVLKKSKEKGLEVRVSGSGWATAQQPAAGNRLPEDRLCTVTFSMGHERFRCTFRS